MKMLETRLFSFCLLLWLLCTRTLAGPPTIISDSDSFTYAEDGRPLTIHCTADPGALVAWYIENIPIDPQDNDEEEPRIIGGDLIFTRVRMRHSGWYTCAVANQFGRAEEDFLVIVGEKPAFVVEPRTQPLLVQPGTRVELPCLTRGLPQPRISWFDRMDNELFTGSPIQISPITDALVIDNFNPMVLPGQDDVTCIATNRFGNTTSRRAEINLAPASPFSELSPPLQSPIHQQQDTPITLTLNETLTLRCIDATNNQIQEDNLEFRWFQNYAQIPSATNRQYLLDPTSSGSSVAGYYCCEVLQNQTILNTYCISVVVQVKGFIDFHSSNVSIPSHLGRHANLLCTGSTINNIDPPTVQWRDGQGTVLTNGTDVTVLQDVRFGFVSINGSNSGNGGLYTCEALNSGGTVNSTTEVIIIDMCSASENVLRNSGAEEDGSTGWDVLGTAADAMEYRNERVFLLNYTGVPGVFGEPFGDDVFFPGFRQEVQIPANAVRVCISGRLRGESSASPGTPIIKIAMVPGSFQDDILQPFSASEAWQWVSAEFDSEVLAGAERMIVMLAVEPSSATDSITGTAFFDDLAVTFSTGVGGDDNSIVVIAAGAGGGGLLLAALLLFCCCCCCCRKKSDAKPMRKMSTKMNVKKRFTLTRWFTGDSDTVTEGSYSLAQTVQDGPMYAEVGRDNLSPVCSSPPSNPETTGAIIYDDNYYIMHQSVEMKDNFVKQANVYQNITQPQTETVDVGNEESFYHTASPPPAAGSMTGLVADGEYLQLVGQAENTATSENAGYLEVMARDKGRTTSLNELDNKSVELLIPPGAIYSTLND